MLGADDRVQVTRTRSYPWRCICALRIAAADGTAWTGTGWLAGPRLVVTAGHCVYLHDHGGWAQSVEVTPGANGDVRPYGSCSSAELLSVGGWVEGKARTHDYGAVLLPADDAYGQSLGYFALGVLPDGVLGRAALNVSGYPADKEPPQSLWTHARAVTRLDGRVLHYDADTAGGQSGCPTWFWWDGQALAVGIHTNGSASANSATRITPDVLEVLQAWVREGGT